MSQAYNIAVVILALICTVCYTKKSNVSNNLYLILKSLYLLILYNENIFGKYTLYLKPLTGPQKWRIYMLFHKIIEKRTAQN